MDVGSISRHLLQVPSFSQPTASCIARTMQGILMVPLEVLLKDPTSLLVAWRHECSRSFGDRLSSRRQQEWVQSVLDAHIREAMGGKQLPEEDVWLCLV